MDAMRMRPVEAHNGRWCVIQLEWRLLVADLSKEDAEMQRVEAMKCAATGCTVDITPAYGKRYCSNTCGVRARRHAARGSPPPLTERICARTGCGKTFMPRSSVHVLCSQYCGRKRYNSVPKTERGRRRATKTERHPQAKYIHELRAEVDARGMSHLCMYCEANRVARPGGYICGDGECLTLYRSDYGKGRRELERATKACSPTSIMEAKTCARPGCGASFRNACRRFCSESCQRLVRNAKRRTGKATGRPKGSAKGILFGRGRRFLGRAYAAG